MVNIKEWLIDWFGKNTSLTRKEIGDGAEDNYLERGWIDSLAFISFISDIEAHFNIQFSNEEFQDRTFATTKGIADIIKEKMEKQ